MSNLVSSKFQAFLRAKRGIAGGAGLLMFGTVFSQLIVILVSPILTRQYTPEDFGILAVYVSVFAFFTIMVSLRYELAIPLSRSVSVTLAVVKLCVLIIVVILTLLSILLTLSGQYWIDLLQVTGFEDYLWLLPLGVFIAGIHKVFNFWSLKKKVFAVMALSRVLQGGGLAFAQLAMGAMGAGFVGLIFGHIFGFAAGLAVLMWFTSRSEFLALGNVGASLIKKAAYRYRKFPQFSTLSDMFNVFGTQFPPVMIAALFSVQDAGFYLLANRVANAPVALVAEAAGKSLMAVAVSHKEKNSLQELSLQVYQLLLKLSLGPMLVVALISPELFFIIFGDQWLDAGRYLQLMMPWIFSVFVFVPLMTLYYVLEQQQVEFRFQILLVVLRLTGLALGAAVAGVFGAILLYSLLAAVGYMLCGGWIMQKAGVQVMQMVKIAFREVLFVALFVGPFYGLKWMFIKSDLTELNWQSLLVYIASLALITFFLFRTRSMLTVLSQIESKSR